jgi:hypothetical protein
MEEIINFIDIFDIEKKYALLGFKKTSTHNNEPVPLIHLSFSKSIEDAIIEFEKFVLKYQTGTENIKRGIQKLIFTEEGDYYLYIPKKRISLSKYPVGSKIFSVPTSFRCLESDDLQGFIVEKKNMKRGVFSSMYRMEYSREHMEYSRDKIMELINPTKEIIKIRREIFDENYPHDIVNIINQFL